MGWDYNFIAFKAEAKSACSNQIHKAGKGFVSVTITQQALKSLNNYNTLMAIIAGFNMSPIHRLKYTWQSLPANITEMYQELEKMMNIEGNYKNYREMLKSSVGGACIPYLYAFLNFLFLGVYI